MSPRKAHPSICFKLHYTVKYVNVIVRDTFMPAGGSKRADSVVKVEGSEGWRETESSRLLVHTDTLSLNRGITRISCIFSPFVWTSFWWTLLWLFWLWLFIYAHTIEIERYFNIFDFWQCCLQLQFKTTECDCYMMCTKSTEGKTFLTNSMHNYSIEVLHTGESTVRMDLKKWSVIFLRKAQLS